MHVVKRISRIVRAEANQFLEWLEKDHSPSVTQYAEAQEDATSALEEARRSYKLLRENEALLLARQELADREIVEALSRGDQAEAMQMIREKVEREDQLEDLYVDVTAARRDVAVATDRHLSAVSRFEKARDRAKSAEAAAATKAEA